MHLLNHGIIKGGLFLLVACITYRTHSSTIDELGGLAQRMPRVASDCASCTGLLDCLENLGPQVIPHFGQRFCSVRACLCSNERAGLESALLGKSWPQDSHLG